MARTRDILIVTLAVGLSCCSCGREPETVGAPVVADDGSAVAQVEKVGEEHVVTKDGEQVGG